MAEYIEREAAIKRIYDVTSGIGFQNPQEAIDTCVALINCEPPADVVEVRHERCDVCGGKSVLMQDVYNGYSIEIDAKQQEMTVWQGDECLAYFHIDFCPNCGARMDGDERNG